MLSGRQAPIPLSNPMRFFTQKYINKIARDSSISKEKRRLLFRHLTHYVNKIPLYLKRRVLITNSKRTQVTSTTAEEEVEQDKPKKSGPLGPRKVPLKERENQ